MKEKSISPRCYFFIKQVTAQCLKEVPEGATCELVSGLDLAMQLLGVRARGVWRPGFGL